jgi:hypothetical protein
MPFCFKVADNVLTQIECASEYDDSNAMLIFVLTLKAYHETVLFLIETYFFTGQV